MNNTLLKGLAIIERLAHSEAPLSLTALAQQLSMGKSNVHRLLQALLEARYVTRNDEGKYIASIKLWELGSAVLTKLDLRSQAENVMEALWQRTGETVHLSVLDGREVVYVHKLDSPNPVRSYTQIGGRARAHCVATGKAMLAFSAPHALRQMSQQLQPRTPHTLTEPARFLKEMERIRLDGYAVNRGEWNENVYGIAAPISNENGQVVAALGLSGPKERFKPARLREFAPVIVEAATDISIQMGARATLQLPTWR